MKSNFSIIVSGICMIIGGVVLFYSLQNSPNIDPTLRFLKHWGTFSGLVGIGVVIAGILLTLTGRQQVPIHENFQDLQ